MHFRDSPLKKEVQNIYAKNQLSLVLLLPFTQVVHGLHEVEAEMGGLGGCCAFSLLNNSHNEGCFTLLSNTIAAIIQLVLVTRKKENVLEKKNQPLFCLLFAFSSTPNVISEM